MTIAIIASLGTAGTEALLAYLVKPLLDGIFIDKNMSLLKLMPALIIGVYFVKGVFRFLQVYIMRYIGQKVVEMLRNDLFEKIINLPLNFFNTTSTGVLMSRITNDVNLVQQSMQTIISILRETLTVIGLAAVILYMDWKLALITILCYPFLVHPLITISRRLRRLSRKDQEMMGGLSSILQEAFSGIRIVKAFTSEKKEIDKFAETNAMAVKYVIKSIKTAELSSPLMEFISSLGFAAIIYFGGVQVINGTSTPGTFFSFLAAALLVYRPIKSIGNSNNTIQQAIAASERIFGILDVENSIVANNGNIICDAKNKDIKFHNVCFKYEGTEKLVLNEINLNIKAGQQVAFVGSSGAGKTTIANLMPRFFDITSGSIMIDGTDIREFDLKSLRTEISIVSQEPFLFNDTIANNIAYGKNIDVPKEDMIEASKAAFADDFINEMPQGYDTEIGERGIILSGGQKQRLTIARALLKNSPILILDEATSSLDTESERIVQKALDNLMKGRTSLIIAHRLSTILDADMIVVLNENKIEATGKHEELLKTSKTYSRLYKMQFNME